jgi:hypothetical protein
VLILIAVYASTNGAILCFPQRYKIGCFRDRLRDTNEVYQAVGNRLGSIHLQLPGDGPRIARAKTLCLFCRLVFDRANQRKGFLCIMRHAIAFVMR